MFPVSLCVPGSPHEQVQNHTYGRSSGVRSLATALNPPKLASARLIDLVAEQAAATKAAARRGGPHCKERRLAM